MFSDSSIEIESPAMATEPWHEEWKLLHHRLRSIAKQRFALEAEEATYLLEAEECALYRRLGYTSMAEYMERELHYLPHTANERLRVAHELLALPRITERFRSGELSFSAVRELTRIATPETEDELLDWAEGKTARQVEHMVAGRKRGDLPDAPVNPALITKRVVLELTVEQYAMWRRMRAEIEGECTEKLSEGEVLATVMRRASEPSGQHVPRPAVQAAITTCRVCQESVTGAAGEELALDRATADRMLCDAEYVGDLSSDGPTRGAPTIPRGIRRKVFIRDHFGCVVPGCRAARCLDVHHLIPRERGGDHSMANLAVLCFGHHQRLHEGILRVRGRAPKLEFAWCRDDDVDSENSPTGDSITTTARSS